MYVTGGCAVGDHSDRQGSCVGRIGAHLDVEHRGQAAQALGADAEIIDSIIQLEAQLFSRVVGAALNQFLDIDRVEQGFLGQHHRFFRRSADTDTQYTGRAPACAHLGLPIR